MNFSINFILEAIAIGLATGIFSGAFGIGGGIVCTPLLRLCLGVSPHMAIGTTMALIIPTSLSGALNYTRKGLVDKKVSTAMMIPAVVGVLLGAALTKVVHGKMLMLSFALLVVVSGIDLTFGIGKKIMDMREAAIGEAESVSEAESSDRSLRTKILVGLMSGCLAGFFGVGGGFILVPCLLYFFKMPIKAAFGTSVVIATVSVPDHNPLCSVMNIPLMLTMMGGVVGADLFSAVRWRFSDSWLRKGFG
ncbi:MAG: sulfite exporter TauE/SafE family protein [Cyanobacteriota/Melainabacteria group bacterium]